MPQSWIAESDNVDILIRSTNSLQNDYKHIICKMTYRSTAEVASSFSKYQHKLSAELEIFLHSREKECKESQVGEARITK